MISSFDYDGFTSLYIVSTKSTPYTLEELFNYLKDNGFYLDSVNNVSIDNCDKLYPTIPTHGQTGFSGFICAYGKYSISFFLNDDLTNEVLHINTSSNTKDRIFDNVIKIM